MPFKSMAGNFLKHPIATMIVGTLLGWGGNHYYYYLTKSEEYRVEMEQGRKDGITLGRRATDEAFEKDLPNLIEKRYPGAIENAKNFGALQGRKDGFQEGRAEGYRVGFDDGKLETLKGCGFQTTAERHWFHFENHVRELIVLAKRAKEFDATTDKPVLLARIGGLIEIQYELRQSYREQAKSFDLKIEALNKALMGQKFELIYEHLLTIADNFPINGRAYLRSNSKIQDMFISLGKR